MGGGGGYAARLFLLFSFPCSADHERDWTPCKVVFFGLATNALNVRNNNNNNLLSLGTCITFFSQVLGTFSGSFLFYFHFIFLYLIFWLACDHGNSFLCLEE